MIASYSSHRPADAIPHSQLPEQPASDHSRGVLANRSASPPLSVRCEINPSLQSISQRQDGRSHSPGPFWEQAPADLQRCRGASPIGPQLQTPRSHRHLQPGPAASDEPVGRGSPARARIQGGVAGPVARKVLARCGGPAERLGVEAVEFGWIGRVEEAEPELDEMVRALGYLAFLFRVVPYPRCLFEHWWIDALVEVQ